jgi:hypothetical protein
MERKLNSEICHEPKRNGVCLMIAFGDDDDHHSQLFWEWPKWVDVEAPRIRKSLAEDGLSWDRH